MNDKDQNRGIFERPIHSFEVDPRAVDWIRADPANPLNQIERLITSGARVLDVGAGNGILAQLLSAAKKSVVIDAVEPDSEAIRIARHHYSLIYEVGLEEYLSSSSVEEVRYDYIVLADVVEHLANPESLLRHLKLRLAKGGKIFISTPNVAFASVRIALLNGVFDYVDSGILERTHLRFFTQSTLDKLLIAVGLYPHSRILLQRNPMSMEIRMGSFSVGLWTLAWVLRDRLSSVYQFLYVLGIKPVDNVLDEEYGSCGRLVVLSYLKERGLQRLRKVFRRNCASKVCE